VKIGAGTAVILKKKNMGSCFGKERERGEMGILKSLPHTLTETAKKSPQKKKARGLKGERNLGGLPT